MPGGPSRAGHAQDRPLAQPACARHGVVTDVSRYLTLDATGLPGLEAVPALDLFGDEEVPREWRALQELMVLDADGKTPGTEDTKPAFISGFVVRRLVEKGSRGGRRARRARRA